MIDSNLLDYQWLCSPEGREHLQAISCEDSTSPSVIQRLRRQIGTERTRLVVEQLELRQRGQRKFTRANQMFFTARLLEQATDEQIAAYKAGRFPSSGLVADLCCGLGGDLLAFGRHGQAIGIDRNARSAQLAL